MAFSDYSTTPSANTSIGGSNVAEGCPPGNVNDALRQLAADGKQLANDLDAIDLSEKADLDAPAFTGQPTFTGKGAFLYHTNAANLSGRIFIQAAGGTAPSLSNGDLLFEY